MNKVLLGIACARLVRYAQEEIVVSYKNQGQRILQLLKMMTKIIPFGGFFFASRRSQYRDSANQESLQHRQGANSCTGDKTKIVPRWTVCHTQSPYLNGENGINSKPVLKVKRCLT